MLANVVTVWREIFSHVEGVVGRRRRVWMTGRPLVPSPAAVAVLSDGLGNGGAAKLSLAHAHTTCGVGPGCGLCESASDSHEHQSSEPSHAPPANLPMVSL